MEMISEYFPLNNTKRSNGEPWVIGDLESSNWKIVPTNVTLSLRKNTKNQNIFSITIPSTDPSKNHHYEYSHDQFGAPTFKCTTPSGGSFQVDDNYFLNILQTNLGDLLTTELPSDYISNLQKIIDREKQASQEAYEAEELKTPPAASRSPGTVTHIVTDTACTAIIGNTLFINGKPVTSNTQLSAETFHAPQAQTKKLAGNQPLTSQELPYGLLPADLRNSVKSREGTFIVTEYAGPAIRQQLPQHLGAGEPTASCASPALRR